MPHPTVRAVVLGHAQDAGVPQAGCRCARCRAAWADPARQALPACLGVVDAADGAAWLVDATPTLPAQLHALVGAGDAPSPRLAGIVLTHAHIGHYAGLVHLGREAMGARGLPVLASPAMAAFLRANAPWRQLVELGNIALREVDAGAPVALSARLSLAFAPVPHRAEWSDTHAVVVAGPARRLLWCPDIDGWAGLDDGLVGLLLGHRIDIACLDATFLAPDELGGRDASEVPHPLAGDTVAAVAAARAAGWAGEAWLIHFNHTNRLLDDDAASAGWAEAHAVGLGRTGHSWAL